MMAWVAAAVGRVRPPRAGQAMIEFAAVMLVFLGAVMTTFEGARLLTSAFALSNAAAEGARAGAYVPTSARPIATLDADIRAAVRATTAFLGTIPDGSITICRRATSGAACGTTVQSGSVIEVTVTYAFQLVPFAGGWLGRAGVNLTGYNRARID